MSGYNRFAPKPYSTSAKPFARMFDSPKFNHNLLPNDKIESGPKVGGGWRGGVGVGLEGQQQGVTDLYEPESYSFGTKS